MKLLSHPTGAALLAHAGEFLRQRDAQHGLLLALAERERDESATRARPYFASVDDAKGVALVAIRTPPHYLVLSALREGASEDAFDLLAADVAKRFGSLPGVAGDAEAALAFAARWSAATGVSLRTRVRLGTFELERVVLPAPTPGALRVATALDVELLVSWLDEFVDEAALPAEDRAMASAPVVLQRVAQGAFRFWVVNGEPVALAGSRMLSVPRVGPVYTPPEHRRRGYASALVAALSQEILDRGARKVTLTADDANPTSNKIYRAIGYRRVGDDVMVDFVPG